MSPAHKKIILRHHRGDIVPGYLPQSGIVRGGPGEKDRTVDVLDLSGHVLSVALSEVKHICYVRDFNLNDSVNPERLTRRTFLARPRTEGLWLRLSFQGQSTASNDLELFEGLAPLDAALMDDLLHDAGLFLIPPDVRSNTQRIYIPRSSIAELQLLAVITTPSRKKPVPGSPAAASLQEDLFQSLPPNSRPN